MMGEPLSLAKVEEAAAALFGVTREDLAGRSRRWPLHHQRTATIIAMRELTGASWPQIGDWFGRDHSTVMSCTQYPPVRGRGASRDARRFAALLVDSLRTSEAVGECRMCGGSVVAADPVFRLDGRIGYVWRWSTVRCGRCEMTFTVGGREFHGMIEELRTATASQVSA